jgi:hypothetical protein
MAVTACTEELRPRRARRRSLLTFDSFANLGELVVDQWIVLITVRVELCEYTECLLFPSLGDEESWALWDYKL